jgi:hypothetical protein
MDPDYNNLIIWCFDAYFNLFLIKNLLPLSLSIKFVTRPPHPNNRWASIVLHLIPSTGFRMTCAFRLLGFWMFVKVGVVQKR